MQRNTRKRLSVIGGVVAGALVAFAGGLGGCGGGGGNGPGNPDPVAPVGTLAHDRDVFTEMLEKHDRIRRQVHEVDGGIESVTESDDPKVAALIFEHVEAMKRRVEAGERLRQWDPLYKAVFDAGTKINLAIERTAKGASVRETSTDPVVVKLIRQHAGVVSGFAARGTEESVKTHPVEP